MPNNAEHIASLQRISIQHPGCTKAIAAAIHALKAEGRSPWRKVGKRHPGKKWEGESVLVVTSDGYGDIGRVPTVGEWSERTWMDYSLRGDKHITHWQPWPEHPEKEVK